MGVGSFTPSAQMKLAYFKAPANWVIHIDTYTYIHGGVHGVMVTVVGNGHGEQSSSTGQGCLHFTKH